jgi:enterochelin esterase-like enzyme
MRKPGDGLHPRAIAIGARLGLVLAVGYLVGVAAGVASRPPGPGARVPGVASPDTSSGAPLARRAGAQPPSPSAAGGPATMPPEGAAAPTMPTTPTGPASPPVAPARAPAAGPTTRRGSVSYALFPGPWTGGPSRQISIGIYLPPGYVATPAHRYPVIYEVPYSARTWILRMGLGEVLDRLISAGTIPPELVVFVGAAGGPYRDSECADSFDGRERFESFVVDSLVPWVDAHYPVVASPEGRAVMGSSQGGYCAAALWSHHPDIFGAAISESGYFVSGVRSPATPTAWRPFGGNAAYESAQSPIRRLAAIRPAERSRSLVLLEGSTAQPFFGPQMIAFEKALSAAGIPFEVFSSPLGHSSAGFRRVTPAMLVALAKWMIAASVVPGGHAHS